MKRVLISTAICAASLASGQVTPSGNGYLLRVNYKPGQVIKHTITTIIPIGGPKEPPIQFGLESTLTIKSVKNGRASAALDTVSGSEPQSFDIRPQHKELILDRQNRASANGDTAVLVAQYPAGPIKVGQGWKAHTSLLVMRGQAKSPMDVSYTFKGLKTVKGRKVAVIDLKLVGLTSGVGTLQVDAASGIMSTLDVKAQVTVPNQGSVSLTIQVRRTK